MYAAVSDDDGQAGKLCVCLSHCLSGNFRQTWEKAKREDKKACAVDPNGSCSSSKLHSPVVFVSRLGTVGISFGKRRAEGRKEERETTRDHTIVPSFTGKGGNGVTVFPPSFLPALTAAAAGATLLDSMCDGSVSRSQGEESVLIVSTGIEGTHSTYKY